MKNLKKLNLINLESEELARKKLAQIKGGSCGDSCGCSCYWEGTPGGSTVEDNCRENLRQDLDSPYGDFKCEGYYSYY